MHKTHPPLKFHSPINPPATPGFLRCITASDNAGHFRK
jgi:hypothetical protein